MAVRGPLPTAQSMSSVHNNPFRPLGAGMGVLLLSAAASVSVAASAEASSYNVLFSFCAEGDCSQGSSPQAALVRDAHGNFFGTSLSGGGGNGGVVFELKKTGSGFAYIKLYEFCLEVGGACSDGTGPAGGLILDTAGNLYGTTQHGGRGQFGGTVFKLSPGKHDKWAHKILYSFCPSGECPDGWGTSSELTYEGARSGARYDGVSPLFGTTVGGGAHKNGVVFKLSVGQHKAREEVLYSFCALADCADGIHPSGGVVMDARGNLYGNTAEYGANGLGGTTYTLMRHEKHYSFSVLHNFCAAFGCPDGQSPAGALTIDANGDLLGATRHGGAHGWGTVFKIARHHGGEWKRTTLYSFCGDKPDHNCSDGREPNGNLLIDASGDIFGTTQRSEKAPGGVIYRLRERTQSVLYKFCSETDCQDGATPVSGLIQDTSGNLFGTTTQTAGIGGTIFEFTP